MNGYICNSVFIASFCRSSGYYENIRRTSCNKKNMMTIAKFEANYFKYTFTFRAKFYSPKAASILIFNQLPPD